MVDNFEVKPNRVRHVCETTAAMFSAGCRNTIVVGEGRWVDDVGLHRRCVIMKLPDFTVDRYQEALRQKAAAVLILLPSNVTAIPQDSIQVSQVPEGACATSLWTRTMPLTFI